MVEFRILRAGRRVKSKLTTMDFRRADYGLFKDLLRSILWDKVLEGRGAQESWLISKDHILQAQDTSIPMNKMSGDPSARKESTCSNESSGGPQE